MKPRFFDTYDEGVEALEAAPDGAVLEPMLWRLRLTTWEEKEEQETYDDEAVWVSFTTRADLMREKLTDDDLIALGRLVVEVAATTRKRT